MTAHAPQQTVALSTDAEDIEPLDIRTQRCLADISAAWRSLAEITEMLITLHQDHATEHSTFMAAACMLVERVRHALDEAEAVAGAVPTVVDAEVRARLQHTTCESLLLQVALLAEVPQA